MRLQGHRYQRVRTFLFDFHSLIILFVVKRFFITGLLMLVGALGDAPWYFSLRQIKVCVGLLVQTSSSVVEFGLLESIGLTVFGRIRRS